MNLALHEQKEKITEKVILSMTAKEHHKAQEEVRNLPFKLCYKIIMSTNLKIKIYFFGSDSETYSYLVATK